MAPTADPDGSEDVNDFLQRIKELGDLRDREDEERTRKLEEEIIQGRRERQARRAERARSISPTKDASTHSNTPGSTLQYQEKSMPDTLSKEFSLPQPHVAQISTMGPTPQKSGPPYSDLDPQGKDPVASTVPPRSTPLSWQQRPSSRGSVTGPARTQPSSNIASEGLTTSSPRLQAGVGEPKVDESVSQSQIAQTLGAKDPAFFRQTQDRGLGSAAYRKNQVEEDGTGSVPPGRSMKLPGMSGEKPVEPDAPLHTALPGPSINLFPKSSSVQQSMGSSNSDGNPGSVTLEDAPRSDAITALKEEAPSTTRAIAMSPSQGRLSSERRDRPVSPTKGLGGFVQSAMMKRSDSVNKRWSAQAGPGLSRGNSVTSALGTYDSMKYPTGGVTPFSHSRQSSTRETTPSNSSRPTSSQSNLKGLHSSAGGETTSNDVSSGNMPADLLRKTSGSISTTEKSSVPGIEQSALGDLVTSPSSPSKRWSPTKSSWLGNAISKPESPKILSPAISQQPAWMVELNRSKQQRGSVDLGGGSNFNKVAIGGLMRSPPPGVGHKSPSLGGFSGSQNLALTTKSRTGSVDDEKQHGPDKLGGTADVISKSSTTARNPTEDLEKTPKSLPATNVKLLGHETSPLPTRTKPETPPKKDFRSSLKSQQISSDSKGASEPEFKNVFGKLKKTQTQNFVAPDELKENIMRGKTGLAKTGGPQKSVIRDEFKESILKKKEGMVLPTASTTISSASSKVSDTSTPEAIAKRRGLGRSESIVGKKSNDSLDDGAPAPKPEAVPKPQNLQEKSKSVAGSAPMAAQRELEKPKLGLGGGFASSLAGILQKGLPAPTAAKASRKQTSVNDNTSARSASYTADLSSEHAKGPELTHATKGRARGPKRKLPSTVSRESVTTPDVDHIKPQSSPAFTENKPSPVIPPNSDSKPLSIITDSRNNVRKSSQPSTPQKPSTSIGKDVASKLSPLATSEAFKGVPSPQPSLARSMNPAADSQEKIGMQDEQQKSPRVLPSVKGMAGDWNQSPKPSQPAQARSPIKLPTRLDEEDAMANAGLRSSEVIGLGIDIQPQTLPSPRPLAAVSANKSPKSPPFLDRKPMNLQAKIGGTVATNREAQSVKTDKVDSESAIKATQISQREKESPPVKTPKSPPTLGKKPTMMDAKVSIPPLSTPGTPKKVSSPLKAPSESAKLFSDIFDELPSKTKVNVDTQAVLDASPSRDSEKIKTLRKQILEIIDNGKSAPVPSDQEHILFEDSLYLCTHVFGTSTGARKTEVYLWCGDGVSSSAIEDAQLFAKKTAKDVGGKLVLMRQGKEPSIFFQALGGIVITRRGSSSRSDSATYMLCGRRHLGQIAFDEVNFHPQSLCPGFPYIISARGGSLYLWKGNGASADELGCARLIGMDLGLTGEIEEVDVGKESADFWSSFSTAASNSAMIVPQGKHWHLKPACEKYATKLFEVDVETARPKSSSGFMSWGRRGSAITNNETSGSLEAKVREVTPYSVADLVEEGIFVLDAFFEIFVIVRLRTSLHPAPQHRSTKSPSLRAALLFAQDYGILAASAEDRPFVPQSYVVILSKSEGSEKIGEIPEGMKTCFRKWSEDGIGQENVQVLPLAETLMAD